MGIWDRLLGRPRWDGTRGRPPSANGASSFHLIWELPPGPYRELSAELTVVEAPTVASLHFWALQVNFARPSGGGAHLGLQWYPAHPGSTAANWGGYGGDGRELTGSPLAIPSATGNPNTGDFPWRPGSPYRLVVRPGADSGQSDRVAWAGVVEDLERGEQVVLRELWAGGSALVEPMVWSEVFADCDAPGSAVRWRALEGITTDGERVVARRVRVNYQRLDDGGCATTDSSVDGNGFLQRTGVVRRTRPGTTLALP